MKKVLKRKNEAVSGIPKELISDGNSDIGPDVWSDLGN